MGFRAIRAGARIRTRSTTPRALSGSVPLHPVGRRRPALRRTRTSMPPARAASTPWWATRSSTRARAGRRSSIRMSRHLGEAVWIVDLNRQSLDRVVPTLSVRHLADMFERRDGRSDRQVRPQAGGPLCARARCGAATRIDEMSNVEYQRLLRADAAALRERLPGRRTGRRADQRPGRAIYRRRALRGVARSRRPRPPAALRRFDAIDDSRPTVIFAYTIKGYGLPSQGHPQNHSALLTLPQLQSLAARLGADPSSIPGAGFDDREPRSHGAPTRAELARPASMRPTRSRSPTTLGARLGDGNHAGGPGSHSARPQSGSAGGWRARRDCEPGCQLQHQSRRVGQQGRCLVVTRFASTGSPTTPTRSCIGRRAPRDGISSWGSPRRTWSGC